jgi:signal peptidase II
MRSYKYFLATLFVILIDQVVKLYVFYTFPFEGYEIKIFGDWFKLNYITNAGMAFGISIAGDYGKLLLTVFRIIACGGIAWYLNQLILKKLPDGLLWSIALILGGAIGNVVDSTFYGVLLDNAPYDSPTVWFHGKVIDMFFIDICNCLIPNWVPFIGGSYYPLWPVFNIADASIFIGVLWIISCQRKFFKDDSSKEIVAAE